MKSKKTYIYILRDPRDNSVRYVGKSDDPIRRLRRHKTEKGRTYRHNWLMNLRSNGLEPTMEIIEEIDSYDWKTKEEYWIGYFKKRSSKLTNLCSGGNGAPGISPSKSVRKKISDSVKRAWKENPRKLSKEHAEALAASHKGKHMSKETREKISRAHIGKKASKETLRRMSESRKGISLGPHSEETKRKLSKQKQGEKNPQSKLIPEDVLEIRKLYSFGKISLSKLGKKYGVDTKQIHRIVRYKAWEWLQ